MKKLNNEVKLIGHIGADLELKELEGGKKVVNFSLATDSSYKDDKGEKVENTDWHSLTAWGKTAETLCQYIKKGSNIAIGGSLKSKSYEDKDGKKQYTTYVEVDEFLFLDKKS